MKLMEDPGLTKVVEQEVLKRLKTEIYKNL